MTEEKKTSTPLVVNIEESIPFATLKPSNSETSATAHVPTQKSIPFSALNSAGSATQSVNDPDNTGTSNQQATGGAKDSKDS